MYLSLERQDDNYLPRKVTSRVNPLYVNPRFPEIQRLIYFERPAVRTES